LGKTLKGANGSSIGTILNYTASTSTTYEVETRTGYTVLVTSGFEKETGVYFFLTGGLNSTLSLGSDLNHEYLLYGNANCTDGDQVGLLEGSPDARRIYPIATGTGAQLTISKALKAADADGNGVSDTKKLSAFEGTLYWKVLPIVSGSVDDSLPTVCTSVSSTVANAIYQSYNDYFATPDFMNAISAIPLDSLTLSESGLPTTITAPLIVD